MTLLRYPPAIVPTVTTTLAKRIGFPRDDVLQRENDRGRRRNRVDRGVRIAAVAATAYDRQVELVG